MGVGESDFVPDGDLVPDEIQAELIGWRDAFTAGSFRIGDIANSMIVRAASNGFKVTNERIFEAIGNFCGRGARTVRYYAETAAYYPKTVRDEFDVLPFSHFVFARSHGNTLEEVKEVLSFAMEHPESTLGDLTRRYNIDQEIKREGSHINPASDQSYRDVVSEVADMGIANGISREVSHNNVSRQSCLNMVGDLLSVLDRFEQILPEFQADIDLLLQIEEHSKTLRALVARLTGVKGTG